MTIRLLLADDDALTRAGLAVILGTEPDLEVVGEACDGAQVLPMVRSLAPDLVLMDVRMPSMDGIRATELLLTRLDRPPRVLVLTTFENDDYVYDALRVGASGFLLKRARPDQLIEVVRTVARGDSLVFPAAIRALAQRRHAADDRAGRRTLPALTQREREVLGLVAAGRTNAEIAAELVLGVETVKTHVANLLAKLGARDRIQAVIAAYESGFVGSRPLP